MWHTKETLSLTENHINVFFNLHVLEYRWHMNFITDPTNTLYFIFTSSYWENPPGCFLPIHLEGCGLHKLCPLLFLRSHSTKWHYHTTHQPSLLKLRELFCLLIFRNILQGPSSAGSVLGTGVTQQRMRKIKVIYAYTVAPSFCNFTELLTILSWW